ncbi:MAG: HPF/RaiA family ribosome-associated protein [Pseudomonadales bacterium]|nr:HPF/RaiA family ribosome-associated protein [Pseudomonadales bacterium]
MKIEVNAIGFTLSYALQHYVTRRLRFALAPHAHHIKCVIVRLSDINGPRGGYDQHCQIQCVLPGLPDVFAEDTSSELCIAINRTAARTGRSVAKSLKKRQARSIRSDLPKVLMKS